MAVTAAYHIRLAVGCTRDGGRVTYLCSPGSRLDVISEAEPIERTVANTEGRCIREFGCYLLDDFAAFCIRLANGQRTLLRIASSTSPKHISRTSVELQHFCMPMHS